MFSFFKKKKPQQPTPGGPSTNSPSPGKTKGQSPPKQQAPTKAQSSREHQQLMNRIAEEDQWMYDFIVQYLSSPTWRIPILTYLDENCIIFDDDEENKFEYTDIHNGFKKLVEGLVADMMAELEITEDKLLEILQAGIKDPEYKRTFEQLLIIDNFLVFRNLMIKRNKELELEALQQLHELDQKAKAQAGQQTPQNPDLQRATLEMEQAEIAHAMALSLAIEQERQKLLEQEDYELQEALKQSQSEYSKHQDAKKAAEDRDKERIRLMEIEKEKKIAEAKAKAEAEARAKADAEAKAKADADAKAKSDAESKAKSDAEAKTKVETETKAKVEAEAKPKVEAKVEPEVKAKVEPEVAQKKAASPQKVVEEQKVDTSAVKQTALKTLPPLMEESRGNALPPLRGNTKFDPLNVDQLKEERDKINSQIQQIKQEEPKGETLEERKARLKAQRDLILAKKKAERESELFNYEAKKGTAPKTENKPVETISEAEAEKRREQYQKLKGEL